MAMYAVMDGIKVVNTILAEDLETAQNVTGHTCIECPDFVSAGYVFINDMFYREMVFGKNNDLKLLQTQNPRPDGIVQPVVEGYIGYDELNTKLEEERIEEEQILNDLL